MERYLRFTRTATLAYVYPTSQIRGMGPIDDTHLGVYFKDEFPGDIVNLSSPYVSIAITANKHFEVISAISEAIQTSEDIIIEVDSDLQSDIGTPIHYAQSSSAFTAGYHGNRAYLKVLPSDFVPDDGGRPVQINDSGFASDELFLFSHASTKMYASVIIPSGFYATQVVIYGTDTSQTFMVLEGDVNSKTITDIATGTTAIGSVVTLATSLIGDDTNYMIIAVTSDGASDEIYGGLVGITPRLS